MSRKSFILLISLFTLVNLFLVLLNAYYVKKSTYSAVVNAAPTPIDDATKKSAVNNNLSNSTRVGSQLNSYKFIFPGDLKRDNWHWKDFEIFYNDNWFVSESSDPKPGDYPDKILEISSTSGSSMRFIQGFAEGARCLFPEESDYETFDGMGTQYQSFDEFYLVGVKARLVKLEYPIVEEGEEYYICTYIEDGNYYLSNYNALGLERIVSVSESEKQEIIKILESVKQL